MRPALLRAQKAKRTVRSGAGSSARRSATTSKGGDSGAVVVDAGAGLDRVEVGAEHDDVGPATGPLHDEVHARDIAQIEGLASHLIPGIGKPLGNVVDRCVEPSGPGRAVASIRIGDPLELLEVRTNVRDLDGAAQPEPISPGDSFGASLGEEEASAGVPAANRDGCVVRPGVAVAGAAQPAMTSTARRHDHRGQRLVASIRIVPQLSRRDELEEADVAGRVAGTREEHGRLAELLDAVADEMHHVMPEGLRVLVPGWGSLEVRVRQRGEPGRMSASSRFQCAAIASTVG